MAVEVTDTIAGLTKTEPRGDSPTNEGDNHLRLLKQVLKDVFPGVGNDGFAKAITATEDELNALAGLTTDTTLEAQLDAIRSSVGGVPGTLYAPSGTRMLFHQGFSPDGWTTDDSIGGYMVVILPGAYAGGFVGTDNPIFWAHDHGTQPHTLNGAELPPHTHDIQSSAGGRITWDSSQHVQQQFTHAGGTYSHGPTMAAGGGQEHEHGNTLAVEWSPRATGVVVGVKD